LVQSTNQARRVDRWHCWRNYIEYQRSWNSKLGNWFGT